MQATQTYYGARTRSRLRRQHGGRGRSSVPRLRHQVRGSALGNTDDHLVTVPANRATTGSESRAAATNAGHVPTTEHGQQHATTTDASSLPAATTTTAAVEAEQRKERGRRWQRQTKRKEPVQDAHAAERAAGVEHKRKALRKLELLLVVWPRCGPHWRNMPKTTSGPSDDGEQAEHDGRQSSASAQDLPAQHGQTSMQDNLGQATRRAEHPTAATGKFCATATMASAAAGEASISTDADGAGAVLTVRDAANADADADGAATYDGADGPTADAVAATATAAAATAAATAAAATTMAAAAECAGEVHVTARGSSR